MHWNGWFGLASLVFLVAQGCGGGKGPVTLDPYAGATLTAGAGLADLRLGETTLAVFLRDIGQGIPSVVAADDIGIELSFHDGQIMFMFRVSEECLRQTEGLRWSSVPDDLHGALTRYPCLATLTLSSLSVAAGPSPDETFFQGRTAGGAALGLPVTSAFNDGAIDVGPARFLAGLSPRNPDDWVDSRTGIRFYYLRGATGKREDTVITRITVFLPDS